ncbi:MAG: 50S ribosomal protein L5 [Salinispira sp.]
MTDSLPRLKAMYHEKVRKALQKEFAYKSSMQYPRLEKIILSMGVGIAVSNKKALAQAVGELTLIAGQRAIKTRARKSISNFKLRAGMEIGAKVTLRGVRMYEFLDRFISIALPRVKDFRGLNPNAFDGHGNYSTGINEQLIFPEIVYDKIERISGLNVVIVTSAATDPEAKALLSGLGMPFRK